MDINNFIQYLVSAFEIESILCYGSYAQMLQDNKSDIDLLVIVKHTIPAKFDRQAVYKQIPNNEIIALEVDLAGRWDMAWTPVNDRLILEKQAIDVGYNTVAWVKAVIENLIIKNKITFDEFSFRPYTFLGLLESANILCDQNNFIKKCLSKIRPMPPKLKGAIIHTFLPVLKESYAELVDYAARDIGILAFEFQLFRGLDAAISILFAMNEIYDPASKRTEHFLFKLNKQPTNLANFINKILPRFYENKKEVLQFFEELILFIENSIN